ncbi:MAG: extracellular solute-binding protein [Candidatus Cloacimonetes bacterium]|nr:extracellular solute-binding protein [Candidatus Cloacimonadota bacterium]
MKKNITVIFILIALLIGCSNNKNEVIIYCSLDRIYSEPILKNFEKETRIKVKAVYDMEITKTIGLVNRIIAESSNPQCDLFWNNEISRTILLKNKVILESYLSPESEKIPVRFKDNSGYWTGFAARARIIIYNKDKFKNRQLPNSILDLIEPEWKGKAAIANPLFGTTATHSAVLTSKFGIEWTEEFFNKIKVNKIGILDGNATVRDMVVSGEFWWGMTDTDDANGAIVDGKNVGIIYPDQSDEQMGTLIIPNTIALIKNSPNQENAKKLIDYILNPKTEKRLAYSRSAQIPLRSNIDYPESIKSIGDIKTYIVRLLIQ